jgi:hypothetical protein
MEKGTSAEWKTEEEAESKKSSVEEEGKKEG